MSNNGDSGDAGLLANSRARLQTVPQSENPFRAGLDRGMASWRKKRQAQYASIRIPRLEACPTCNKDIATNLPSCPHCGQPLSEEIWKTALSARDAKRALKGGCVLAALIGFGVYVHNLPGPTPEEQARREVEKVAYSAASTCDTIAAKSMRNPSSFSSAWGKSYQDTGTQVRIKRNYTATNGFGATLDGYYICTFNKLSQKIEDIQFRDGNY
jgi:hypothetical protein